jgi:hypothetical protein
MSHFRLRVGDLLHFHPVAPPLVRWKMTSVVDAPARVAEPPTARSRADLASPSLSVEGETVDPRVEPEYRGQLRGGDAISARDCDFLEDLWLWLP